VQTEGVVVMAPLLDQHPDIFEYAEDLAVG
jgi:hypothetical protein